MRKNYQSDFKSQVNYTFESLEASLRNIYDNNDHFLDIHWK